MVYLRNIFCVDCGVRLSRWNAKRCRRCATLYRMKIGNWHNPSYKDGRASQKFCIDCGKKLINKYAHRCKSCALSFYRKGENHWAVKRGLSHHCSICNKKVLNKINICFDCRKRLHIWSATGTIHHGKGAYYKNIWMRSSWEIKYAQWLDSKNIKWEYEPRAFELVDGTTYRPDFYLPETDEWVEVKGWWRPDAKTKYILWILQYPKLNRLLVNRECLKLEGWRV